MTVILLRHGRSTSNTAQTLAGRSEGVDLDDKGQEQARGLVGRIGTLPIRAIVRSPLLRCQSTVEPLAAALGLEPIVEERLSEVDYGEWTGRKIGDLVKEPLWAVVQQQPSAAVFPGGEGLAHVQARAVEAFEVAVDKGVAGFGSVGGAFGQAEVPLGVVGPIVLLEVTIFIVGPGLRHAPVGVFHDLARID